MGTAKDDTQLVEVRAARVVGQQPGVELWLPVAPPEAHLSSTESAPTDARAHDATDVDSYASFPAQQWQHWIILEEVDGPRALPIFIGMAEASAIGMVLSGQRPSRPMSYDVTREILHAFGMRVTRVVINRREGLVFFASVVVGSDNREEVFDARPSDAINMAVRGDAPIYVTEEVLQQSSVDSSEPVDVLAHRVELLDEHTGTRVGVLQNGPLPGPGRRIRLLKPSESGGRVEVTSPATPADQRALTSSQASVWQVVSIEEVEPRLWRALVQRPA